MIRRSRTLRRELESLFHLGAIGDLSDGQLLERFTTCGGEAAELAFAALVQRHGPMVLRVCRGALDDPNDAQDAFQATFLVLVQKARGLWVEDSLGPWLHRVAHRMALRSRRSAARRRDHERRAAENRPRWISIGADGEVDVALIHEEIDRLPDRCRLPVVLCDLEGLTHEQVARHLGWPIGTVKSRLTRGREWLRARLVRRGVAPVAGLAAGASLVRSASAAVPAELVDETARAARSLAAGAATAGTVPATVLSLMEGALNAMLLTKLRFAVLACGLLASGAFVVAQQVGRPSETGAQPARAAAIPRPAEPSDTPDDGAALDVAVNRDMARLDIELLREEVHSYEEHVRKAFRAKVHWEMPQNEPQVSQSNRADFLKKAQNEYEDARGAYREKLRELMIAVRRQADPNSAPGMMMQSGRHTAAPGTVKPAPPSGGAAVGSVDMDEIMTRFKTVDRHKEQFNRDLDAAKQRLGLLDGQIARLTQRKQRLTPNTKDYDDLEDQIAGLKQRLEAERQREEVQRNLRGTRMMAALYEEIQAAIAKVAGARGLDYVVRISSEPVADADFNALNAALNRSVIYANPKNDITDEVIRELNRKFEADTGRPSP